MTVVWSLGETERSGGVDALADALVDGLADRAAALDLPALKAAVAEIRQRSGGAGLPIGIYRLAEVLSPGAVPPAPRQPAGDPAAAADCVRRHSSTLLDTDEPAAVATVLAGLVTDGLRLLVTGRFAHELAAVRAALPAELRGLCLECPEPLSASELRELRGLLVTATPERARRTHQLLPEPEEVPDPDLVARLCTAAGRPGYPPRSSAELVPRLLGELPESRLNGLIETAHRCDTAVSALAQESEASWSLTLLEQLLFGQAQRVFERLRQRCAKTIEAAEGLRGAGDHLALIGTVDEYGLRQLRRYADFLDAGGRARARFRSPEQRGVEPVLRQLRLDGTPLADSTILRQALSFVQLIADVERIGADCALLGLPAPTDIPAVTRLRRHLEITADAVLAVETLRHEVLFIHPTSPVTMPDMATIEAVTRAIIDAGSAAEMTVAARRLTELADQFAGTLPARLSADTVRLDMFPDTASETGSETDGPGAEPFVSPAPEYLDAVRALRDTRLPDYLAALDALAAARRERLEQRRLDDLLDRLRAVAPALAEAWQRSGGRTFPPGTARFQPVHELLTQLPDADTADVVVLVGADRLDPGYLAVAAAAPRLLAAASADRSPSRVGTGLPRTLAGRFAASGQTVSTMLRRSGVPVIAAPGPAAASDAVSPPGAVSAPDGEPPSGQVKTTEPAA